MRRGAFALLVVAGCAKGRALDVQGDGAVQDDAPNTQEDTPPPPVDMPPPHNDAPPDVPPVVDACVPQQFEKLVNAALDLAPVGVGWTEVPLPDMGPIGGPFPIIRSDGIPVLSAPNHAWLGGVTADLATPPRQTVSDQLFQDFAIPADTSQIVVSGFFALQTDEIGSTVFDRFTLDATRTNGTVIESVLTLDNTSTPVNSYTAFSKTISAAGLAQIIGTTVRLRAMSTNDDSLVTNFFLDTFSVQATHCP